jgi:hypothetical protein
MLSLLEDVDMPVALKTMAASGAAAAFRILLMPIDATKTIMQVSDGGWGGVKRACSDIMLRETKGRGAAAGRAWLLTSSPRL